MSKYDHLFEDQEEVNDISVFREFFSFNFLTTPFIIQGIFKIFTVIWTFLFVFGSVELYENTIDVAGQAKVWPLILYIFGSIFFYIVVRIFLEMVVVFFKIYEELRYNR